MSYMRGLNQFITDIRHCQTREQEQARVDKELAHIRSKFTGKALDGYNKKKYVWKLLYMYMLGYEIDVGHMEALKLVASNKYSEKVCGYVACSVLLNERHEMLRLIIQSVKKDLGAHNPDHTCLALACIANVGGQEFAESLTPDVQRILLSSQSILVRKKAALCLLRLYRKYPDAIPQDSTFPTRVIALLDDPSLGLAVSVSSLLLGLVSHDPTGYEDLPQQCVYVLTKLIFNPDRRSNYKYYLTICPWLQVRLLRLLQYFSPPADKNVATRLNHVLSEILTKTTVTRTVNKNNADHSILFEAISVIIHLCAHGSSDLHGQAVGLLGRFVSIREPNFRYLGLETMARLARVPGTLATIKRHQNTIQFSLNDPDISIRKRALDLLYVMCDKFNAKDIVNQLCAYLVTCSFDLKEELVLKIAILAEKFAPNLRWYLDIILRLLTEAGDSVTDDIWYRVCQIVTNNEDLQEYAATTCFQFLKGPAVHENGVKVGAYILGEFGHQIKDPSISGLNMFEALREKFPSTNSDTKALILSAFIKMANTYPELKENAARLFSQYRDNIDCEIQQRACEYYRMNESTDENVVNMVFDMMPNFPEKENVLLKRLKKSHKNTTDRDVWVDPEKRKKDNDEEGDDDDSSSSSDDSQRKEVVDSNPNVSDSDSDSSSGSDSSSSDDDGDFPAQDKSLVHALFTKDKGSIYESEVMQVLLQTMVENGHTLKMIIYYGNKSKSPLVDLSCQLPNSDSMKVQVRPLKQTVNPGTQAKQLFLWVFEKPFTALPAIKLNFMYDGEAKSLILGLPILMTTFLSPSPTITDAQSYIKNWQETKASEVIVTRKLVENQTVEQISAHLRNLHFSVLENVDAKFTNICAAGAIRTVSGVSNVVLRLETHSVMPVVRLTVHAVNKAFSEAIVNSISTALKTQNA